MTNKKFKMAAMSLALTACVAASPLAANAESPENTSDAAQPSAVQHEDEPETAEAPSAAADETAPDAPEADAAPEQEPAALPAEADITVLPAIAETPVAVLPLAEQPATEEAPAEEPEAQEAPEETPDAEQSDDDAAPEEEPDDAAPAEEPAAQPAEDIAVLPAQPEEKPVVVELPSADEEPSEEPSSEETPSTVTVPEESSDESTSTTEDAAAQPSIQLPVLPTADSTAAGETAGIAAENPYGISTMLPGKDSMRAVSRGEAMIAGNENVIYGTLGDAVNAAKRGDTITVDQDVTWDGILLADKDLTVEGVIKTVTEDGKEKKVKPKLTFTNGISIKNAELILRNLDVSMKGISSTPNTEDDQIWMGICLAKNSTLTLDNTDLTMDGTGCPSVTVKDKNGNLVTKHPQGIYMDAQGGYASLNVINGSHLIINNYYNAVATDGATGTNTGSRYEFNIKNGSSFNADHNEAGIVGRESLTVTVDKSEMHITNCTRRNGSEGRSGTNGANFSITDSTVDVSGNADGNGLHANDLYVKNSTITANNNGYAGIRITGKGQFIHSRITVSGTLGKGHAAIEINGIRKEANKAEMNNGSLEVTDGTILNVSGNQTTGIALRDLTVKLSTGERHAAPSLTIDDSSLVTIRNNTASSSDWNESRPDLAGGLLLCKGASAKLGANTIINNNHAAKAGDDLYLAPGSSLIFSVRNATGNGDLLDDCGDRIDGWYLDAEGNYRWNFHGDPSFAQNLLSSDVLLVENGDGTYTLIVAADSATGLALKAAHAELPAPGPDGPTPITPDDPTPNPPEENSPVLPENPELPPVQDARFDAPVLPENPVLPAVQDAHVLPQTGMNLFAALSMALSGFALMAGGAFASLTGKNARH